MVDPRICTENELRQIQAGARAYDRMTETQLAKAKEYAESPLQKRDVVNEIYDEIEADNLDTLSFLARDIGVLNKVRETFRNDPEIQEYTKYLIMMNNERMNELMEEIANGYGKF
jgi:predicted HAD superfamily hydrolase